MAFNLENLQPFAGTHAIQHALVHLVWKVDALQNEGVLRQAIDSWAAVLPGLGFEKPEAVFVTQFSLSAPGTPQQVAMHQQTGLQAKRFAQPGLPDVSLRVSATDGLVLQFDKYTRWHEVRAAIEHIVRALLPVIAVQAAVERVGLQYLDSFVWRAALRDFDLKQVLRVPNAWVAPHVFEVPSYWHSNHGYFEPVAAQGIMPSYRQLNNVNISVGQQQGVDTLQAAIVHQADLDQDSIIWAHDAKGLSVVMAILDKLHGDNKVVVGALLADSIVQRISLWPSESNKGGTND